MTKTIDDIDNQIKTLKNNIDTVRGRETEVYTRIVGYYRTVRNWNNGK